MALGVIRIRGNSCRYSGGPKKGKFTTCKGKRITGGRKAAKRRGGRKSASGATHCRKKVVSTYGNKRCREICTKNGKRTSSRPTSDCKW